ncbi:MAG: geranylgeranylglycerol-phosphate geranylgeranyltransferase [Candidatus Latescibacterota bacterium]|nr:geranylgeranylglycerol-phosphate geranylgeranyltransferase [Candidatus Latescibacterota bacterium]
MNPILDVEGEQPVEDRPSGLHLPDLIRLTRPLNGVFTALSAGVGALTAASDPQWVLGWDTIFVVAAATLIGAAGNVDNDLLDLEIDRVNRPHRPLPAGRVSPLLARTLSLILVLGGFALAHSLGGGCAAIAAGVALGLVLYNRLGKNTGLAGNLLVSLLAASTFPFGALAVSGGLGRSWIPAGFALLYHLGREIVKDVEDATGDRGRRRSLALTAGPGAALSIAAACLIAVILLSPLPWWLGHYGYAYLLPVLALDAYLFFFIWRRLRREDVLGAQPFARSRSLRAAMSLGLLAVVLGELWHYPT